MRVFVTGATGHIGSALVPELLQAGHQVTGLARSDKSAAALAAMGAEAHRGDIDDLDGLRAAASVADGVIHLAYRHDFDNDFVAAADADLRAVEAMGDVLAGSDRPLVNTSGTLFLPGVVQGRTATEHDTMPAGPRIDSENATIALADKGVRSSVVRLVAAGAQQPGSPRFRPSFDRHCPRKRGGCLHRRRLQPVAGSSYARRGAPLPARSRKRFCGNTVARCCRRRRAVPRHRRRHRPPPRCAGRQHFAAKKGRATSGSWASSRHWTIRRPAR